MAATAALVLALEEARAEIKSGRLTREEMERELQELRDKWKKKSDELQGLPEVEQQELLQQQHRSLMVL